MDLDMTKCPQCGEANSIRRQSCFNCGTPLPKETGGETGGMRPATAGLQQMGPSVSSTPPGVPPVNPPADMPLGGPAARQRMGEMEGNTSGGGSKAVVPSEIKKWNWGAFFLTWIWGIAHGTWLAFLVFVPFVGGVMPFVLGAKGSEWAWQNRKFKGGVAEFKKIQKAWSTAGLAVLLISVAVGIIYISVLAPMLARAALMNHRPIQGRPPSMMR